MPLTENQRFIWYELMTETGRRRALVTIALLALVEIISLCAPYGLGTVTAGVSKADQTLIMHGLIIYLVLEGVAHGIH